MIFLKIILVVLGFVFKPFRRHWQKGMSIECLVVGYGGANNTGAEARTSEAIRQMLATDPRIVVTLTSLNKEQSLRYLEETGRLHIAEINPIFVISVLKLALRADIVVLVEGSCFKENFSSALLWFFMYSADIAQRFGIPTVTYGVDAGNLSSKNRIWARDVANKMELLMVRTHAAEQVLKSAGVTKDIAVTTDTAFSLEAAPDEWAMNALKSQQIDFKKPIVGIAFEEFYWWPVVASPLRAILGKKEDHYKSIYYHSWSKESKKKSRRMKEEVAEYADWVVKEFDAQVVLIAMEHLDIGPCRDVASIMVEKSAIIDADYANAKQMAAVIRKLDWLVTCRYHALVFAMGGFVPTIGLAHDERIATILDELQLMDKLFISYEEKYILDLLKEKTHLLRKDSNQIRRTIERSMPSYIERMNENQRLFAELIVSSFPE